MDDENAKPLKFVGSSQKDLREMPDAVRKVFGKALFLAQMGKKSDKAKPLKGFRGAGVLEIVEDFDTDTYRAIYTVRFARIVYALHIFQKKSRHGISTPTSDLERIARRSEAAEEHYAEWTKNNG